MKLGSRLFLLFTISLLLASCSGVRYLENGEKLLYKQHIEGVKKANKNEITDLLLLEPNIQIPIIGPIGAYIYESGANAFDSAKISKNKAEFIQEIDERIEKRKEEGKKTEKLESKKNRKADRFDKKLRLGNGRMRTGSPLAVYDSLLIQQSATRIKNYLYSKGFRKSDVSISTKEKGRKVTQTFLISEGKRSFIDSLSLRTGDSTISKLINESKNASFLKVGDFYNRSNMESEQERIELLLRNNGYFEFSKRFVEFVVQFAPNSEDLWITTIINKPAARGYHKQFNLDSVVVNVNGGEPVDIEETYFDVKYNFSNLVYSPRVMDTRLKLNPNSLYSYTDVINTQRQLLNMDMFKFVNINFDSTLVENKFIANIYTSPLQRFQLTQELGVNVVDAIGPFYNLFLRNRNTFSGAEVLQFSGFVGSDGVSAATDRGQVLSNIQYGGNVSLTFPRFVTPFNTRELSKNSFNAKSILSLGYSFITRPEYDRRSLNGSYGYSWQNEKGNNSFRLNLSEIRLINTTRISESFAQQLEDLALQGNTLAFAFNRSFVSSASFNAIFNRDYGNTQKNSSYTRLFLETGGTLYNFIGTGLLDNNNLTFYKFGKIQFDYRKYIPLSSEASLSWRSNIGYAQPYGDNRSLPYENYFFSGGSSSNRAWVPRRLGPGASFPYELDANGNNVIENGELVPDRTGKDSYRFERPGEVLLEMSLEYRGKITGFIDWAFFIDAGNVWRLREPEASDQVTVTILSEGGQFEFNDFYKEIAVGAGLGLRFDFSFLVFRFDVGHKLKDPRFPEGQRWRPLFKNSSQTVWNIAVGYPF